MDPVCGGHFLNPSEVDNVVGVSQRVGILFVNQYRNFKDDRDRIVSARFTICGLGQGAIFVCAWCDVDLAFTVPFDT